ncbi:hypothetical protein ACFQ1S_07390 [Kibdelosporangium lantanae]|uniref:Uncharacterized protein n=1 Tax=Kibdelosporangium lantanae TaxID=1497396 RepID=A0ABW3M735_9PSEU
MLISDLGWTFLVHKILRARAQHKTRHMVNRRRRDVNLQVLDNFRDSAHTDQSLKTLFTRSGFVLPRIVALIYAAGVAVTFTDWYDLTAGLLVGFGALVLDVIHVIGIVWMARNAHVMSAVMREAYAQKDKSTTSATMNVDPGAHAAGVN